MIFTTAASARLSRLFHYQAFDAKRITSIVSENRIYFSNPQDFNDPWDCKPWFDAESLNNPDVFERHVQWYTETSRKHTQIPESQIQNIVTEYKTNPELLQSKIRKFSELMGKIIGDKYRVYCLAENPTCELLWAHYSDKHTGICLEFSTGNTCFSTAVGVRYAEKYPSIDVTSSSEEHNLQLPLVSKSNAWAYEREFRLISQEETMATHNTLISKGGFVEIPADALKTVIVGCRAKDSTVAELKSIMVDSGKSVALKRIVRAPNRYELLMAAIE